MWVNQSPDEVMLIATQHIWDWVPQGAIDKAGPVTKHQGKPFPHIFGFGPFCAAHTFRCVPGHFEFPVPTYPVTLWLPS